MSVNKDIKVLNTEVCIKKEMKCNLKDILSDLKKDDLKVYIVNYELKGYSKLKKADLIDAISDKMFADNALGNKVSALDAKELELVQTLVASESVEVAEADFAKYTNIYSSGLVFPYIDGETVKLVMPVEVKEVVAKLGLKKETVKETKKVEKTQVAKEEVKDTTLLDSYLNAFGNLYGAFEPEFLATVFNSQNNEKVTAQEIVSYFEANNNEVGALQLVDGVIADVRLVLVEGELAKLQNARAEKEYKLLSREMVLKYANDDFIELSPAYRNLVNILSEVVIDKKTVGEALLALSNQFKVYDFNVENILNVLSAFIDIETINNVSAVENIVKHAVAAHCETRRWDCKGFTKDELNNHKDQKPATVKVKRNDPCPCGSGKKYKKCCLK